MSSGAPKLLPRRGEEPSGAAPAATAPRRAATPAQVRRAAPSLKPSPSFFARFVRDRYEVQVDSKGKGHIVPKLYVVACSPGSNGVLQESDGKGRRLPNPDPAIAAEARRGNIVIPWETPCTAHGVTHPRYINRYAVPGGAAHLWAWEQPIPASDRIRVDVDARIEWLKQQAEAHLGPTPEWVEATLRGDLEGEYAKLQEGRGAAAYGRLRAVRARLQSMGWDLPKVAKSPEIVVNTAAAPAAPAAPLDLQAMIDAAVARASVEVEKRVRAEYADRLGAIEHYLSAEPEALAPDAAASGVPAADDLPGEDEEDAEPAPKRLL